MTAIPLSELQQAIETFNAEAKSFKNRRDVLVENAVESGLSRRHINKVLASVTVRMPDDK